MYVQGVPAKTNLFLHCKLKNEDDPCLFVFSNIAEF